MNFRNRGRVKTVCRCIGYKWRVFVRKCEENESGNSEGPGCRKEGCRQETVRLQDGLLEVYKRKIVVRLLSEKSGDTTINA